MFAIARDDSITFGNGCNNNNNVTPYLSSYLIPHDKQEMVWEKHSSRGRHPLVVCEGIVGEKEGTGPPQDELQYKQSRHVTQNTVNLKNKINNLQHMI